jgi:hypothetical protein
MDALAPHRNYECWPSSFLQQVHLKIPHPEFHSPPKLLKKPNCEAVTGSIPGPWLKGLRNWQTPNRGRKDIITNRHKSTTRWFSNPTKKNSYQNEPIIKQLFFRWSFWLLSGQSPSLPDVLCIPPEGTNSWSCSLKAYDSLNYRNVEWNLDFKSMEC